MGITWWVSLGRSVLNNGSCLGNVLCKWGIFGRWGSVLNKGSGWVFVQKEGFIGERPRIFGREEGGFECWWNWKSVVLWDGQVGW
ncbi:hypothetical protein RJT34_33256 [Clitoria ternatea]|uniref:Uncharacterized protein n=1 Tax=Clitoria ternatea TaxID=43366 RepID=A0AAN9EXI5_CLITE